MDQLRKLWRMYRFSGYSKEDKSLIREQIREEIAIIRYSKGEV